MFKSLHPVLETVALYIAVVCGEYHGVTYFNSEVYFCCHHLVSGVNFHASLRSNVYCRRLMLVCMMWVGWLVWEVTVMSYIWFFLDAMTCTGLEELQFGVLSCLEE